MRFFAMTRRSPQEIQARATHQLGARETTRLPRRQPRRPMCAGGAGGSPQRCRLRLSPSRWASMSSRARAEGRRGEPHWERRRRRRQRQGCRRRRRSGASPSDVAAGAGSVWVTSTDAQHRVASRRRHGRRAADDPGGKRGERRRRRRSLSLDCELARRHRFACRSEGEQGRGHDQRRKRPGRNRARPQRRLGCERGRPDAVTPRRAHRDSSPRASRSARHPGRLLSVRAASGWPTRSAASSSALIPSRRQLSTRSTSATAHRASRSEPARSGSPTTSTELSRESTRSGLRSRRRFP